MASIAEKLTGEANFEITEKMKSQREFSRSLYFVKDIKKGELITEVNVRSVRPGFGLHPKHHKEILGKKVNAALTQGTPMSVDFVCQMKSYYELDAEIEEIQEQIIEPRRMNVLIR